MIVSRSVQDALVNNAQLFDLQQRTGSTTRGTFYPLSTTSGNKCTIPLLGSVTVLVERNCLLSPFPTPQS